MKVIDYEYNEIRRIDDIEKYDRLVYLDVGGFTGRDEVLKEFIIVASCHYKGSKGRSEYHIGDSQKVLLLEPGEKIPSVILAIYGEDENGEV